MTEFILGIESSCDDTSVAVVSSKMEVLSQRTVSQTSVHKLFGGVIPEIAARNHIAWIIPAIESAMKESGKSSNDISAIAVTNFPGLIGSLLVGVCAAKGLSMGWNKPLIAVNHLDAHISSAFLLKDKKPQFPYLALVVSGGHTSLIEVNESGKVTLGETMDDAAGEAYDKVAKMADLGYPGGPVIDKLASTGNKLKYKLPYLLKNNNKYADEIVFSFSGIKSAVKRVLEEGTVDMPSLMAAFQDRIVELIERKMRLALSRNKYKALVVSGGVSANSAVRAMSAKLAKEKGMELFIPELKYCQDNGAMVAAAAFEDLKNGKFTPVDFDVAATVRTRR
ncbi:MAG TPA: tRNA (adenosine(37)-N6)-threonylcarbamoyltransferase complex transferase subunit TsaD [bacterium]|nr:tRNA (adenosine(37)-N6)-threonylcarbamoyltransferase complex transferase subunit TsaD [bacterium]HPS30339.1 tRNA (adenosine(37)-N6)-threonylcarbamoyltransferase complex transferase subunit TsaD [bacterium]